MWTGARERQAISNALAWGRLSMAGWDEEDSYGLDLLTTCAQEETRREENGWSDLM